MTSFFPLAVIHRRNFRFTTIRTGEASIIFLVNQEGSGLVAVPSRLGQLGQGAFSRGNNMTVVDGTSIRARVVKISR